MPPASRRRRPGRRRLHVGELGQDLARQQAAVAGDDVVVVERRHEHQARDRRRRGAGPRLRPRRRSRRRPRPWRPARAMPARLTSGVCADTSTVASTPKACAASATPRPWLPADAAMTAGRPPPSRRQRAPARGGRAAQLERAGALQALQLQPDVGAGAPAQGGRGHQRRHPGQPADALGDLAAGDSRQMSGSNMPHAAATVPELSRPSGPRSRRARRVSSRRAVRVTRSCRNVVRRRSTGWCEGATSPSADAGRVEWLWDEIRRLKREKNAFIPAHNYQVPEVQAIADTVGDSFELAVRARDIDADLVVFCGVRFMAEGCYTLAPQAPGLPAQPAGALLAGRGRRRRGGRAAGVPARAGPPVRRP